ncbi:MAG: glycosyltransferase [Turicibacter sp.]
MKKRILFVNDEMVVGGVARVLNNLLKELVSQTDYEIDLLVLHKHGEMLKDIPSEINVIEGSKFFNVIDLSLIQLLKEKKIALTIKKAYLLFLMKSGFIISKIKKERKKMNLPAYDVEIAFKEGFCTIFVGSGDSAKKVNWVHLDYKVQNFSGNHMPLLKKSLKFMDEQVAVSKVAASSYQEVFELAEPVKVIHNIINVQDVKTKFNEVVIEKKSDYLNEEYLTFVSIGRLADQKGYDRLINVHERLIKDGFNHQILIVGDGENYDALVSMIEEKQVGKTFKLMGYRANPFPYLKWGDAFVLSSRYEGLPTVVFESLICQTPVMATQVAGIDEQLNHPLYGVIVENNEEGLYEGMKALISKPNGLKEMKTQLENYEYHNDQIIVSICELVEGNDANIT